ncbi:Hypothetical protein A7982_06637 [Minicystis rosea]|nr:Hypothetical protein A7982_06637 [Minicystis rosea]
MVDAVGGALWAATYVLILRRGSLDRAPGVPLPALCAAISWEFLFTVVHPIAVLPPLVVALWLAIDAGILYQYLRYGPAEERRTGSCPPALFHVRLVASLGIALVVLDALVRDWHDWDGAYTGYAVNVIISLSFIAMLARRRDLRGQSMYIALGKLFGSLVAIPHAYVLHGALRSLRAFMAITVLADVVYAVLLFRQMRCQGIRPWRRV